MITEDKELGVYDRRLNVDPDVVINVYDVIETFGGLNAAAQHGLKKLLVTGGRSGEKSKRQDYVDVIESVKEAMRLDGLEPYETFRNTIEDKDRHISELNSLVDFHAKRAQILDDCYRCFSKWFMDPYKLPTQATVEAVLCDTEHRLSQLTEEHNNASND